MKKPIKSRGGKDRHFFKTNYNEILFSIFSNTCGNGNHGNWRPLFKLRTILFRMDKLLCMVFSFRIF
jgi:hypothetical protein